MRLIQSLVLVILALSGACSSLPQITPEQRQAMQNHLFEGARYDVVFQAFATVLRDDGYTLKIQDQAGGLIVASVEKTAKASAFFAPFKEKGGLRKGEGFELSINFEIPNPFSVKARTTIQRIERYALSAQQGEEVLEPEVYRNFYDMVRVEVARNGGIGPRPGAGGLGKPPKESSPLKLKSG